jgi:hypothetical protein
MTDNTNTSTTRMLALPAAIIFSIGSGDSAEKISRDTAGMTDTALTLLLTYGTRKLNDTRNGAKKDAWGRLRGQALVDAFLAWADTPKTSRTASDSVSPAEAEAIKEYLSAKRTNPVWKKAEATHWVKKTDGKARPMPKSLGILREYLAVINKLTVFPSDKWAGIESTLKTNIAAIEARRAELAEEGGGAEDLLG